MFAALAFGNAVEAGNQVSLFAGRQVSNSWEEVFTETADLDWRDSGIVGIALGGDWPVGRGVSFGVEAHAAVHVGEQHHAEFNLPLFVRYAPPERLRPLESFAFGIGPSFATEVPEIGVETRGGSERALLYCAIEAEFATPRPDLLLSGRLHHQSNGYGTVADRGGSNILVMGLRRRR